MIYFEVDCEHGIKIIENPDPTDWLDYHDGRLFRTDGVIIEAMYQNKEEISWKVANPKTRV